MIHRIGPQHKYNQYGILCFRDKSLDGVHQVTYDDEQVTCPHCKEILEKLDNLGNKKHSSAQTSKRTEIGSAYNYTWKEPSK